MKKRLAVLAVFALVLAFAAPAIGRVIVPTKRTIKTIGHWPCTAGEVLVRVDPDPEWTVKRWRCEDPANL